MMQMRRVLAISATLISVLVAAPLSAQQYPTRPIKVLIGFAPGGAPDTVLRQIASRLDGRMGTQIVVENRPGASGTVAATAVANSAPDGYTLLFGVAANLAVAPATLKSPPYDPVSAFAPIVEVARGPYVWLVRSDAPARSLQEFIAWARANPGKLNYASPGLGTVHHLATEMFKRGAGLEMVHVPYRSGMYPPLLAREVDAMFDSMPAPQPHLAAGTLRALGVTGPRRLRSLPEVPTFIEQGLPDMEVSSWWGFVGPAGLPRAIVARLNDEIRAVLAEPEFRAALAKWNIEPTPGSAEAFGALIAQEWTRWQRAVRTSGMPLE